MKMIIWRAGTLWLSVALVFWFPSCRVDCTEPDREAQRSEPLQDISLEEESRDSHQQDKDDESLALLPESLSGNEESQGGDQKDEQSTQAADKKETRSEVSEPDKPPINPSMEVNSSVWQPEPEHEQRAQTENLDASTAQDKDSLVLIMSSDTVHESSAEETDGLATPTLHDTVTVSVSDDANDAAHPEVLDSDLAPAECAEEANPFDHDRHPPVVLENMSNVHTTGTKTHSDPPSAQAGQHLDGNLSHTLNQQDASGADPSVSGKDPEDIPTFDEWKRKMMEVENEKTLSAHTSTNGGSNVVKKVQKNFNNYASVECGAKILGANPEAKSTAAILKENMDLYMLNPCSNKIWFIIELCEPIQVKQLDIANFELFSSTPKDFLVSISDRYPTNKWLKLGTFHARDERTVQSFPLDEQLYAKYVKVELLSHFGSEHFCPLSLIRVFGTSMVEEYEEIAEPSERAEDQDDDLDDASGYGPGEVKYSKNLIGSAKDVIFNMVNNIAVNVLGGNSEMQGNLSSADVSVNETRTPTPIIDSTSVSELQEATSSPDAVVTESGASPSATAVPQQLPDDPSEARPPPPGEQIVIPLESEEEESIGSTITLLDEEEESDGEREKMDGREAQLVDLCAFLPLFASCSCGASLQEYLQQQCLVLPSKTRKCPAADGKQRAPSDRSPARPPPSPSSACPEPERDGGDARQPHEKRPAPEGEPESGASPSLAPQPPEKTPVAASRYDPVSQSPPLEPSQTSSLAKSTGPDSSAAHPTVVETPRLPSEAPAKPPSSDESRDTLAAEKQTEASPPPSSSVIAPAADDGKAPPTELQAGTVMSTVLHDSLPNADVTGESQTASPRAHQSPDPAAVLDGGALSVETSQPSPHAPLEVQLSSGAPIIPDSKTDDLTEDASTPGLPPLPSTSPSPSLSDIYADPPNGTEQNGNPVHGSSQKESVFMRLNNRIKALEMNMSLSGRYLEQLSQRYRKQMEEMQKAFNKTIIKLQNTSRIAEEQDQRQTESIQLLQGQLENVTQMVLNLSVQVSQLKNEVSDRHNYLLLCLLLSVCLGVVLLANRCRISITPPNAEPEPPALNSYTSCCPERNFTSGDDCSLKRSASYPLIHSFQLVPTQGLESLHPEESQANRKKRRRKMRPFEKVPTLTSFHGPPLACNGAAVWNGAPVTSKPAAPTRSLLVPAFRESPSEGSSETSSHSDDPSLCGINSACSRMCQGLSLPKTRAEKRALRRRRPKPTCAVVDFLRVPQRDKSNTLSISATQDIMSMKSKQSSGTFGLNLPLSGPV